MRDFIKSVSVQATAILLAALGAALFTFLQSVAAQTGVCPSPSLSYTEGGMLGAAFKSAHSAFLAINGRVG